MNKLKLIGSNTKDGRYCYILEKNDAFFSLFSKFLMGCKFSNLDVYEDYQISPPNIQNLANIADNLKNTTYDIDVIYTEKNILLIIRTDVENFKYLKDGIKSMIN
jgi:hypothetical protein